MLETGTAKAAFLLVILTTLANFFAYLFQLLMGRMLGLEDYGLLFSLLSLWNILNIMAAMFSLVAAKYSAASIASNNADRINSLMNTGITRSLFTGLIAFIILLAFSPILNFFLHISNPLYLPVLFLSVITLITFPLFTGILQGMQRFFAFGLTTASVPFVRLIAAIIFVQVGFGVIGGVLGIVLSCFVGTIVGFFFLKDIKCEGEINLAEFGTYPGLVLASAILFGVLGNIDVILSRHFLDAQQAGIYSMVAVLGRIILYAPIGIGLVLFPKVAFAHEKRESSSGKLIMALVAVVAISGFITLLYFAFPLQIISLLFGQVYLPASEHLALYGSAMLFLAIIGVFYYYQLSKARARILPVLVIALVLQVVLIMFFHNSIQEIILSVLISNIVGVFALFILWVIPLLFRHQTRQKDCR